MRFLLFNLLLAGFKLYNSLIDGYVKPFGEKLQETGAQNFFYSGEPDIRLYYNRLRQVNVLNVTFTAIMISL